MTTHIATKESQDVIESNDYDIECARCGSHDYMAYKSWRDIEGMDDDLDGKEYIVPEERREYIYVCRRCDWKLMNGYPVNYSDDEAFDDEEDAREETNLG